MFPNLQLDEPKGGDKVSATTIRNLVKSVKSLQPTVGWGMRISKTPMGVMYELDKSVIQRVSKTKMPFDASLKEQTQDSANIVVTILSGNLYYGVGSFWCEVERDGMTGDGWNVSVSLSDGVTIGIVTEYESSETNLAAPENFHVDVIPSNMTGNDSGAWVDAQGLHYYPLVRFVDGTAGYEGPYIFSVNASVDGAIKTFYAVQSHHGDVFFEFNDSTPFVARISSGSGGRYSISVQDGSGQWVNYGYVDIVELSGAATFPSGSRIICQPIYTIAYGSGSTSSSS